jgi:hypothetical protein
MPNTRVHRKPTTAYVANSCVCELTRNCTEPSSIWGQAGNPAFDHVRSLPHQRRCREFESRLPLGFDCSQPPINVPLGIPRSGPAQPGDFVVEHGCGPHGRDGGLHWRRNSATTSLCVSVPLAKRVAPQSAPVQEFGYQWTNRYLSAQAPRETNY